MFHSKRALAGRIPAWMRPDAWPALWAEAGPDARRRAIGLGLALVLEVLLIALLLTLGQAAPDPGSRGDALVSFTATSDEPDTPEAAEEDKAEPDKPEFAALQAPQVTPQPVPTTPAAPLPAPPTPPLIPLKRDQMTSADISNRKPAPPRAVIKGPMGPPDTGSPGDSQRVGGSGPNGEPLYAAAWYREPYDDELRGYLSTATSPGWALINCKTVPDFRVEDCVLDAEYPQGAGIGRAVMAAAWQFRVRPPRVGGRSKVGEWVRIRITYDLKRL